MFDYVRLNRPECLVLLCYQTCYFLVLERIRLRKSFLLPCFGKRDFILFPKEMSALKATHFLISGEGAMKNRRSTSTALRKERRTEMFRALERTQADCVDTLESNFEGDHY